MSTLAVARKDLQDAIRSRSLIALVVVFVIFAVAATYLFGAVISNNIRGVSPAVTLIISLLVPITILVPLIGVMTGYKSIVGERTSGTSKLLLSLPHTRGDVVLGKSIGRVVVLAIAIIVGFVVSGIVALAFYNSFPVADYVLFTLMTVVLGAVYLSFSLGLSAATKSGTVALWGSLGFFALVQFLWGFVVNLIVYVINGFSTPNGFSLLTGYISLNGGNVTPPNWYQLLNVLSPNNAYQNTLGTFLTSANLGAQGGSLPYYLQNWFGFVVLAIWIVVPLVLGYARFRQSDL